MAAAGSPPGAAPATAFQLTPAAEPGYHCGYKTVDRRYRQEDEDERLHAHGTYKLGGGAITVTVTDAGLRSLTQLTELEELDLHDTAVTDQGLPLLSKLAALTTLDLRGTKVSEQGTAALARSLPDCRIIR